MGQAEFHGAKLALFLGAQLVVIERDDVPGLLWPGRLDLPGGGRKGNETAEACVLRETAEEVGLTLAAADLTWRRHYAQPNGAWFFVAHKPQAWAKRIVFGDEGQGWSLMSPEAFIQSGRAVPHFQTRLQDYLASVPANQ